MPPPDRSITQILLKPVTHCTREQQFRIREIRNQQGVRSSMYTEHIISIEEHLNWINRLLTDNKQTVYAILKEEQTPLGIVSVNAIDKLHKKADWAFYLDEIIRGGGLGAAIEFHLIELVFNELGLEKLNCEVIETNQTVVKLHKKFLFVEEGYRRSNIEKAGKRIGVHFLGLTKEDWTRGRTGIYAKYESVISRFHISHQ